MCHELDANTAARERVVHDLNADPNIPLPSVSIDDAVCCASVDYLTRPVEVFREVARLLRPGGRFVCTFSNRMFATKAIRAWLYASEEERCRIVVEYFRQSDAYDPCTLWRAPTGYGGDPLYAVWAARSSDDPGGLSPTRHRAKRKCPYPAAPGRYWPTDGERRPTNRR